MARKLKVFRTPAGFHDAYVAAPSRKAALAAWGATADLFARGAAEEVTDPALMEAPLATPGKVVKRSRGTAEEQLAAAPPVRAKSPKSKPARDKPASPAPRSSPAPRPSRAELTATEAALEDATSRHAAERKDLAQRLAALQREQRAAEQRWRKEAAKLEEGRDAARRRYDAAIADWRG